MTQETPMEGRAMMSEPVEPTTDEANVQVVPLFAHLRQRHTTTATPTTAEGYPMTATATGIPVDGNPAAGEEPRDPDAPTAPGRTPGGHHTTGSAPMHTQRSGPASSVGWVPLAERVTPVAEVLERRGEPRLAGPGGGVDWAVVAAVRSQASDRLTQALAAHRGMDRGEQEQFGRAVILELLATAAADRAATGAPGWTMAEQDRLARAVFDALFGLGRLQPLVDDPQVENVIITGCDRVVLEFADGTQAPGPAVADSDQELIEALQFLASRSQVNARSFSESTPALHLRLDGGARLAATAWVTPRPSAVVRVNRLARVTLDDLVTGGVCSPVVASFLAAAVRARLSVVVSGEQGYGKTTWLRALCGAIPPSEAIGTFETEYELHLHEMPDRHPIVHAWEARTGTGERLADGRRAGEYTLCDALYDSFRFNLSRLIVGEVRGQEVLAMFKAMQSSSGSLSTTHARDARGAVAKLITCAMEAGAHVTEEYATRMVATCVDLVVQIDMADIQLPDGTSHRRRWVSEVVAITPGEHGPGYAFTHVFGPAGPGLVAEPRILPDHLRGLARYGFDVSAFTRLTREAAS